MGYVLIAIVLYVIFSVTQKQPKIKKELVVPIDTPDGEASTAFFQEQTIHRISIEDPFDTDVTWHSDIFFEPNDPQEWHEYKGQELVKEFIQLQIDVLKPTDGLKFLFISAKGQGKTTLFRIIGKKLLEKRGGRYIEVTPAMLRAKKQVDNLMASLMPYDILCIDECFTGDMEVLTDNGFVRFDELQKTEKIAQYHNNGTITFVKPIRYINKPYNGEVLSFYNNRTCDITVTPNHDLLYYRNNSLLKTKAKELSLSSLNKFKVAGMGVGNGLDNLTAYEKLLIAAQADGSLHSTQKNNTVTFSFSFSKERKIREFIDIMQEGGFAYSEVKSKINLRRFMVKNLPESFGKNLWYNFNISSIGADKARKIIEEMVKWDGSIINNNLYYYSSVNKNQANFYQIISVLAGYKSNLTYQEDNRKESYSDVHRLFIAKNKDYIGTQSLKKTTEWYSGSVYCITVPSGNIIVRRSGNPIITGNCHMFERKVADLLLPAIEDGVYPFDSGMARIASPISWMGATTDVGLLPEAFQDRFQVRSLERLTNEQLAEILFAMDYPILMDSAREIAKRAVGSPRELKKIYRVARDIAIKDAVERIGPNQILNAFRLLDLDPNGLYSHDRKVLQALRDHPKKYASGKALHAHSERAIRALTGLDEALYRDQVEPKLIGQGFLTISTGGRELTDKAWETYFNVEARKNN